jgi:hypothetical protein
MELTMQERKKLTMVVAQAYWKATKSKKTQMLDDFCQSTGYCRRYAARVLHQACQRYLLGDCILVADPAKHVQVRPSHEMDMLGRDTVLPGMVPMCSRHSSPSGVPVPSWVLSV